MRSARGRRRTWRAARQAAEQVRDGNRVGETWREVKERLKKGERGEERQHRKSNEATLHLILHVSQQQQHQQQQQQQQPQHADSAQHPSACYLAVISWLTYPFMLSGLQHLRTHEYVGQPPVNVVDWTVMGAVTPVKNREQCDSCWATSSLEGDGFIFTGNMLLSSEQQLVATRSIPLVTAGSWTTASLSTRRFPCSWEKYCKGSASA